MGWIGFTPFTPMGMRRNSIARQQGGGGDPEPPPPEIYADLWTVVGQTAYCQLDHAGATFWSLVESDGSNIGINLPGVLGGLGAAVSFTLQEFDYPTQHGLCSISWAVPLVADITTLIVSPR